MIKVCTVMLRVAVLLAAAGVLFVGAAYLNTLHSIGGRLLPLQDFLVVRNVTFTVIPFALVILSFLFALWSQAYLQRASAAAGYRIDDTNTSLIMVLVPFINLYGIGRFLTKMMRFFERTFEDAPLKRFGEYQVAFAALYGTMFALLGVLWLPFPDYVLPEVYASEGMQGIVAIMVVMSLAFLAVLWWMTNVANALLRQATRRLATTESGVTG